MLMFVRRITVQRTVIITVFMCVNHSKMLGEEQGHPGAQNYIQSKVSAWHWSVWPDKSSRSPKLQLEIQLKSLKIRNENYFFIQSSPLWAGEPSPKLLMMTPCGEKDHTPVPPEPGVPGIGYFLLAGTKLSAGLVELIKSDPAVALKGEKGCGYQGCESSWWDSLEVYNHQYPREVMCEQREVLHPVVWADPEQDGCRDRLGCLGPPQHHNKSS